MKERIQKVLASAGVASRRHIEQMVLEGRISVNGQVVRSLPVLVDVAEDQVEVDGERLRLRPAKQEQRHYYILNKPKGVYSTNVAQGVQTRAIDLLPPNLRARLYPVGRLDAESKGLLLLTNDGELTNRLTHPRYGVAKTYRAVVEGIISPEVVRELEQGIWLADKEGRGFKTGESRIRVTKRLRDRSVLEVNIREGRNRQVRRMLAKLGHKVRDLTRIRMGPLTLEGLPPGHCRPLTPRELRELRKLPQEQHPAREEGKQRGRPRAAQRDQHPGGGDA
jgi:23S rRNA pseudouridine2605 synthase